jgi:CxxC motif-containing protein
MDEKEITCIICPLGCKILVKQDGTLCEIVGGNKCKRGVEYARSEALDQRRMLTSSISVIGGTWPLVSVKTTKPVPKKDIFTVLKVIQKTIVKAPVERGQILLKNVADTQIDVIATKTVDSR